MAIQTSISVTLTAQFMRDLGFTFDSAGNITSKPSGIWSNAIWFANNDVDSGNVPLIADGVVQTPTPILDTNNQVTGFKFTIPAFTQSALVGGVMYIALASDTAITSDPFAGLSEGQINNIQNALTSNFTFGTFEFTLQGGPDDQGDLTAISTFGLPMSAQALVDGQAIGSVGYNISAAEIWSQISSLGSSTAPSVYLFDSSKGPLTSNAFAITPTTAVGGGFTPPTGKQLPFFASDWYPYLDSLAAGTGVIASVTGVYNGAAAPVNNWVTQSQNVQVNVWHNAGFFDYELSYQNALNVQVNGVASTISGFLLSPTASSQVKGYIVIPKGNEAELAAQWGGGLANSIYSTLGMAQVYAQDPSQVSGQTPFLFQNATPSNNGSASENATTEFFNVGANTQWGKVFTQLLTGFAAGYVGSTGNALNPWDKSLDGSLASVNLSQSWNWDPTYAFDQNLKATPYGGQTPFRFTDEYAKIFFQNSNIYGDMYSDNLMSLYRTGSPLLTLSNPAGGNVDEVNLTVFSAGETPSGYVMPTIANYPWSVGQAPVLVAPSSNGGIFTLNFKSPAGGDGQQTFVVDDSRMTLQIRVWDPSLNDGAGGFSNSAELPAFPTAQLKIDGIVGQQIAQGTVLTTTGGSEEGVQWTVQSTNNFITPPAGTSSLNGSVIVTVTANKPEAAVTTSSVWNDVALAFPSAVSPSNSSASVAGSDGLQQVTVKFAGDGGASFAAGYLVDSNQNQWAFPAGVIDGTTGTVDVVARASVTGVSVAANESWAGLFQNSTVTSQADSVPGVFWSNYAASYEDGALSFINQTANSQPTGELQLINLPLGQGNGDVVWYQLIVTDTQTQAAKAFNFYPQFGVNTPGSQNIDGGASISLGGLTNQYTINFAGSGTDALPSSLFVPDQVNGNIPLQGTPSAPVIGTQTPSFYQYLGQSVNFTALTTSSDPIQPTTGSNTMTQVPANSYVFGWTGLNPEALADQSLKQWTNKANGLDIVQVTIADIADPTRSKTVFAQADLDGQWLTGRAAVIDPVGSDIQLSSKAVSLVAGRSYQITYQEFLLTDAGLERPNPQGSAPISNPSQVLTIAVAGESGFLDVAQNDQNNFVYSLYEGLLDRVPDQAGFEFWAAKSSPALADRAELIAGVMSSVEFQSKWANLSDAQFVNAAYAYVLERAPDATGAGFWFDALDQGQATREEVLQGFLESAESVGLHSDFTQNGFLAIL
jgi:hypothetical protein